MIPRAVGVEPLSHVEAGAAEYKHPARILTCLYGCLYSGHGLVTFDTDMWSVGCISMELTTGSPIVTPLASSEHTAILVYHDPATNPAGG